MNRKAILIESSNAKNYDDLPGARVDIENWNTFLRSDYGGGWTDAEIVILRKPWSDDVDKALEVKSDCYCFVAYSGHGHDGTLVLNDAYQDCPIARLKPKGDKGTLIIDSCRGVTTARQYTFSKKAESFANESRQAILAKNALKGESMEIYESREVLKKAHTANAGALNWMKALKNSSNGTVQMYSCAAGEEADEDPDAGGAYTSLLLESAEVWSKQITTANIHNTKNAHDYAVKKLPPQQNPEYSPSWLYFPFAAKG